MSQSKQLIKYYRLLVFWCDKLENASACYKAKEVAKIEYTDDERVRLHQASHHLSEAKRLVNEIYSKRIGEAVTYDVRIGVYK